MGESSDSLNKNSRDSTNRRGPGDDGLSSSPLKLTVPSGKVDMDAS
jgi:hypothetical protein